MVKNKNIRIIYGINSDGLGHASRSSIVIDYLRKKGYKVYIACGKNTKAEEFLKEKYRKIYTVNGLSLTYDNNEVRELHTLIDVVSKSSYSKENLKIYDSLINKIKPQLVISDLEPFLLISAKANEIPSISIDHQSSIFRSDIEFSSEYLNDFLIMKIVSNFLCPYADIYMGLSFFKAKITQRNTEIFNPILREEIYKLKPKTENYILVYYRYGKIKDLTKKLNKFTAEKFIIFGYNENTTIGNCTFKKQSPQLLNYLANSKAVILNGGHNVICEAIYFKKPIYSIPVKHQFEQITNAYYLEKLGYGKAFDDLNYNQFKLFLNNLDAYQNKLNTVKFKNKNIFFRKLEKNIKKLKRRKEKRIVFRIFDFLKDLIGK
ncbi:MAG: glycosyltransferase family protein [archaeon]